MLTSASKWPSRWWRWMEMRWPGSSGSSLKRRWFKWGEGLNPTVLSVSPIFIHTLTRGCVGGEVGKITYVWCRGGACVMFHSVTGWLPPVRADAGSQRICREAHSQLMSSDMLTTPVFWFVCRCLFWCLFVFSSAHPVQRWCWAEVFWSGSAIPRPDRWPGHHRLCPGY